MGIVATLTRGHRAWPSIPFVANKVRSGLTILGVTIGVIVVMVMAADGHRDLNSSFKDADRVVAGSTTFYLLRTATSRRWYGGGVSTGLAGRGRERVHEEPDPLDARLGAAS